MLRHAALCLYLLVQCTIAIEWDELVDRVQDHHDTIEFPGAENRDDWLWDDIFWRYPHMMRMECPDGYGWEGNYKDGHCEACQPGHYSASWGPTVRCVSCRPGTYQPSSQSHECISCPEWSPLSAVESESSHDCHKWPIGKEGDVEHGRQGDGRATVEAKVEVMGDWTFLNDMLEQISGYEAHEMSAHVMYDAERKCSMGTLTLVMAERAAFEAHMYVQDLKTMIHLVNDWIHTGHSYVNRIFSMLNVADSLYLIGLNMDPSNIHRQLKDLQVATIDSSLYFSCDGKQTNDDGSKVEILGAISIFACIEDEVAKGQDYSDLHSEYVSYGGESEACMTLGGKTRLAQKINLHWEVEGCKKDDACHMSLKRCDYDKETKESFVVVYVAKKYSDIDLDLFDDVKLFDDMNVEFDLIGKFKNCPGGPVSSSDTNEKIVRRISAIKSTNLSGAMGSVRIAHLALTGKMMMKDVIRVTLNLCQRHTRMAASMRPALPIPEHIVSY
ncbi:uncharacterized protein LOC134820387 [Bolinopsis microptera]|uniref:uncharacterized protein LOC134820387 n=1 Tax=Bolinopsis microptera TaxID=2820187 RepID=UPI00307AB0B0